MHYMASGPGSSSESSLYRPDIDGLRAIAILSVLGFHAAARWVPGGFVGVDLFFVISGYLITGIILKSLVRGTFSLTDFYARRIRRIFPALTLMLLAVLSFGWLKLYPDEYNELAQHVAAGSAYISNFVLTEQSGYFDTAAELKPLLHLWSLGIEEQFYLFWPLLLALTWRFRRTQWTAIVGVIGASLLLNLARVKGHPTGTFYLPQTRLWELGLGGILARAELVWPTLRQRWQDSRHGPNLAAAAGLLLLCGAIAGFDRYHAFPGWRALLPTLGAVLLIAATPRSWINRQVLGNRAMIFIGQISYPLYLWHWPLLAFGRIIKGGDLDVADTVAVVATAFVLSVLTYRYIELPIRNVRPKQAAVPLFTCAAVLGACAFAIFDRQVDPLSARYGVEQFLRASKEQAFVGTRLERTKSDSTGFPVHKAAASRVLFLGDSNVEQYYPRIDKLLTADPSDFRTVVFATGGGCPPIAGVVEEHHPWCNGLIDRAISVSHDPRVDTIVVGAAWQSYFVDPDRRYSYHYQDKDFSGGMLLDSEGGRRALQSLDALLGVFAQQGKKVFLILQIPVGKAIDPRNMISRSLWHTGFEIRPEPLARDKVTRVIEPINSALLAIARRHGVTVIDPLNELCGKTVCPTVDSQGTPMYRDVGHLRPGYVRDHVTLLDHVLRLGSNALNADIGNDRS